ncbi:MAG: hypothetical protein APF77_22890 [Clostridia bacterium BRH_c25]|nr:MAG: hypothetical protein APF77_22890 [Clostridia bacterium BRH_c25]
MLQIRKIRPEDISFVMELAAEKVGTGVKLLSNIENILICENDNIKCGCGCLVPLNGKGYMSWVIVDENHRRKKLGGAITKSLLNIADRKGIGEVYAAGICEDFLKAMGFEETENKSSMNEIKEVLGDINARKCYKVSLKDYFRPCSHK